MDMIDTKLNDGVVFVHVHQNGLWTSGFLAAIFRRHNQCLSKASG